MRKIAVTISALVLVGCAAAPVEQKPEPLEYRQPIILDIFLKGDFNE